MPIEFVCPTCTHTLRVADDAVGRVVRCGSCMTTLCVPAAVAHPAPPPEPVAPRKPSAVVTGSARPQPGPKKVMRGRAKPKSRVAFWVGVSLVGAAVVLGLFGFGLYYLLSADWRTHESAGGFKVDLPAAPKPEIARQTGIPNPQGIPFVAEGTTLRLRSEEYIVLYLEIPTHRRQALTDEALIADTIAGMQQGQPDLVITRNERVDVSGFTAHEVEGTSEAAGRMLGRVVVAETRAYIVLAGGKVADANNARFRRFIDSFEVTDEQLKAKAFARKEAPRRAAEQARLHQERQAEEQRLRLEREAQMTRQLQEQQEQARREAEKREAERIAADKKRVEDDRLALEKKRLEDAAEARRLGEAFRAAKWTGPAVPSPAKLPGLVVYLPFDEADGPETVARPWGSGVQTGEFVTRGEGVRGRALYLPQGRTGFAVPPPLASPRVLNSPAVTLAAWVRVRGTTAVPFAAMPAPGDNHPFLGASLSAPHRSVASYHGFDIRGTNPAAPGVKSPWAADEKWHHIALVRSNAEVRHEFNLYLDGVPVRQGLTGRSTPVFPAAQLWLGYVAPVAGPAFPGSEALPFAAIDEFCLFDQALSDTAVAYLAGVDPNPPGDQALRVLEAPAPMPVSPKYAGGPVPAATDFKGLTFYLAGDLSDDGKAREAVTGRPVGKGPATLTDGVRGKALRVFHTGGGTARAGLDLSDQAAKLNVAGGAPFTLAVWVRGVAITAAARTDTFAALLSESSVKTDHTRTLLLMRRGQTRDLLARVADSRDAGAVELAGDAAAGLDVWTHLALSRSSTGEVRFLVNGRETAERGRFGGTVGADFFGLVVANASRRVRGDIDEFCAFDRALTDDEIVKLAGSPAAALAASRALAAAPPPRKKLPVPAATDFPGLRYYLACDDIDGTAVKETVSGKFVGTLGAGAEHVFGVRGKGLRLSHAPSPAKQPPGLTLDPAAVAVKANTPFTLSLWVREEPGAAAKQTTRYALYAGTGVRATESPALQLFTTFRLASGAPEANATLRNREHPAPYHQATFQTTQFRADEWTHYAVVRDHRNRVLVFVNGEATQRQRHEFPGELRYESFGFVRAVSGPVRTDIDEFALFDRALTDDEIVKLAGSPAVAPRPVETMAVDKYLGDAVPAASDFPGLRYYLTCDDIDGPGVKEAVSGKRVGTFGEDAAVIDGVRGKALRLTGLPKTSLPSSAGLTLDADALKVDAGKPFTVSFWARRVRADGINVSLAHAATEDRTRSFSVGVNSTMAYVGITGKRNASGPQAVSVDTNVSTPAPHTWTHYAVVRSADNQVSCWVNGRPGTRDTAFVADLAYRTLTLASCETGKVVMDLDEFAVFDRGLSSDEILKLAGNPKPPPKTTTVVVPPPGTVGPPAAFPPGGFGPPGGFPPGGFPKGPPMIGPPGFPPMTAAAYSGGAVPAASDFPGLRYYLTCDDIDTKQVKEAVSGKLVGKLVDGATLTDGVRGKAVRLEASNAPDRAAGLTLDPAALKVPAGKPFTLSYWARRDPAVMPTTPTLTVLTATGPKDANGLRVTMNPVGVTAHAFDSRPGAGKTPAVTQTGGIRGVDWSHCVLVRDATNKLTWWVNGVAANPQANEFTGELGFDTFALVSVPAGSVRLDIDEFALFDRALTDDEVAKLGGGPRAGAGRISPRGPIADIPAATEFKDLRYYLTCDEIDGTGVAEAVSKKTVGKLRDGAATTDGVRGKALRLVYDGKASTDPPALTLDGAPLKVAAGQPFTLSYWARKGPATPATRIPAVLLGTSEAGTLTMTLSLTQFSAMVRRTPAAPPSVSLVDPMPDVAGWNHFALVRDDANTLALWVNGVRKMFTNGPVRDALPFDAVQLVKPSSTAVGKVQVDIDEFCLFDRALSAAELSRLAGVVAGPPPKPAAAPPKPAAAPPKPAAAPPKPGGGAVPPATDFKGLQFYLSGDDLDGGKVKDEVSGVLVGKVNRAEQVAGVRGRALRLTHERTDATPGAIELGRLPGLAIPADKPFTLAYWVRLVKRDDDNLNGFTAVRAESRLTAAHGRSFHWYMLSSGSLYADLVDAPSRTDKTNLATAYLAGKVPAPGGWAHVAVVRAEGGGVRLLVNGAEDKPKEQAFAREMAYDDFTLVSSRKGVVVVDIDEFCLFDRALTAAELKRLAGAK